MKDVILNPVMCKKTDYDRHKGLLDSFKARLVELEDNRLQDEEEEAETEPGDDTDSPLEQVRKKKKDMGIYAVLGVGTTAFLAYKTKTCCSQCGGFGGGGCCGMCTPFSVAAILAAAQTLEMFKKKGEFGETERALCVKDPNNANQCLGDKGPGNGNGASSYAFSTSYTFCLFLLIVRIIPVIVRL